MAKSRLLLNENMVEINKQLATVLGLNESIVLLEIINQKETNGFYVNLSRMAEDNLPYLDTRTVRRIINKLESKDVIKKVNTNREMIIENLRRKPPVKSVGNKKCLLCNSTTAQLHHHHYPLKDSEGGTETIGICPNCHSEFHYMEYDYEINYKKINILMGQGGY